MNQLSFSTWICLIVGAARRELRIYENHIRFQTEMILDKAEPFQFKEGLEALINRLDNVTNTVAEIVSMGNLLGHSAPKHIEVS